MLWKPSYHLVRGSSLDDYPCRLDGWIHSIGLGERKRRRISSFKTICRSHNLLKQSVKQTGSSSSVESITRSPSLLQLSYSAYSLQAKRPCLLKPTSSQLQFVSLNLTPTTASIYRSTAYITFDLQPVLRYSLLP